MRPKKKPGRLKQRFVKGVAVGAIGVMAAGCSPKSRGPEFIMHDLNLPANKGKAFNYVPLEFQHGGRYALNGSAPKGTGARNTRQRPMPKQVNARGPSGAWPKIFEIYPRWKPKTKTGRATVDLVNRLCRQTGVSPVELLQIKEEHFATRHYLERARNAGKLSPKEIMVLEALINAAKTDKKAYFHLHRLTGRLLGSKERFRKLTEGK